MVREVNCSGCHLLMSTNDSPAVTTLLRGLLSKLATGKCIGMSLGGCGVRKQAGYGISN